MVYHNRENTSHFNTMRLPSIFHSFLASTSISLMGGSLFDVAVPLHVWDKTHSPWYLALTTTSLLTPYFLMAPLTGFLADRADRRKALLFSDMGQIVCLALMIAYELSGAAPLWPLWILIFLAKTFNILFETITTFHLIPSLVSPAQLPKANSWFLSSQRFIQIAGPLLAGVLMEFFGFKTCILINLLSFAATLQFVFRFKKMPGTEFATQLPSFLSPQAWAKEIYVNLKMSIQAITSSPIFRPFIGVMFFWNLSSLCPNTPSMTYFFRGFHQFSSSSYGIAISLFGGLGIVGFVWAPRLYQTKSFSNLFSSGALFQACMCLLSLFFIKSPWLFAVMFALSRVGGSVLSMGTFLLRQTHFPPAIIGSVNAVIRMFFMSAAPVSAPIQGWIIGHWGIETSFALGAGCLAISYFFARKVSIAYQTKIATPQKEAA